MPRITLALYLCLLLAYAAPAVAQEQLASAPDAAAANTMYHEAGDAFKKVYAEIETLRGEYQNADEPRRKEINAQLPKLLDQAQTHMDHWAAAGLALYKLAPNEDQQLADWLVGIAKYYAVGESWRGKQPAEVGGRFNGGDNYELALPVIQALIEGGHPDKNLYVWGGMSAVCTNDFELARKYLTAADEAGLFDITPEQGMSPDEAFPLTVGRFYESLDELEAQWTQEQEIRNAEAAADDLPRVKFSTTKGDVVIELFENEAPIATANMISLVKDGFYTNVVFHRVLPQFMAQGGDPTGTGSGGPGYTIACECYEPDARKHFRGTLSMAHAGRDTGGSQFFMCFVPTDFLNGRHTAFGRVIEGMDVLGKLQRIDPQAQGQFPEADKIIKAEVLRDRGHGYTFEKLPGR